MKAEVVTPPTDACARQCTDAVLMVRPGVFHSNPQTQGSNAFQRDTGMAPAESLRLARAEFDGAVRALQRAGVQVVAAAAEADADAPDALFPNNWFSTHEDGTVVLYPMAAENRRRERRPKLLADCARRYGWHIRRTVDLSELEKSGQFLEGTGSVVFDRANRLLYAAQSSRTHREGLKRLCQALGFRAVLFSTRDAAGVPIYHTNVMLAVGRTLALLGTSLIAEPAEAKRVTESLQASGHEVLDLSAEQIAQFAGNALFLEVPKAGPLVAISARALVSLSASQRKLLERHATPIPCALPTIESVGGGGIRCMLAEIFLPFEGAL